MHNNNTQVYSPTDNTSDIIIDKLIAWKVEMIFSLVGDGVNPIYEGMRKRKDKIRLITVRHEECLEKPMCN